jgi:hypothetical protein
VSAHRTHDRNQTNPTIGLLMIHGDRPPELVHALVGLGMAAITLTYGVLFARAMRTANGTGKGADRLSARAEP